MTASEATPTPAKPAASWGETLGVYLQPRVLIVLFLGFSCGLPLALTTSTLQIWMRESGVNLGTIGLFALVGTPYTIKFLWAPVVDALNVPLLSSALGRRRGWLVLSQLLLIAAIVILASTDPSTLPIAVAFGALLVAIASATQDTVVDAFRVESLHGDEQAAGMAAYVAAYRVGLLVSTVGALLLVAYLEATGLAKSSAWTWCYVAMAAMIGVGVIASILATEPERSVVKASDWDNYHPQFENIRLRYDWLTARLHAAIRQLTRTRTGKAAYGGFTDFLAQKDAWAVLAFVVLFKLTDAFAGNMTAPFVIDVGYTKVDYAAIVKGVGFAAALLGGFAGGFFAHAWSLPACLWLSGIIQAVSNLVFFWLASIGINQWALAVAIGVEQFTGAIGTVIFVAYLSALCRNPIHTATQFALLTAMSAVARTYLSSPAGYVAEWAGWRPFFVISVLVAIPSLLLLAWLQRRDHFATLQVKKA